jgi:hypothetical protein
MGFTGQIRRLILEDCRVHVNGYQYVALTTQEAELLYIKLSPNLGAAGTSVPSEAIVRNFSALWENSTVSAGSVSASAGLQLYGLDAAGPNARVIVDGFTMIVLNSATNSSGALARVGAESGTVERVTLRRLVGRAYSSSFGRRGVRAFTTGSFDRLDVVDCDFRQWTSTLPDVDLASLSVAKSVQGVPEGQHLRQR